MRMRASGIFGLALAVAVAGILATTPGHANCGVPTAIFLAFATYYDQAGDNPYIFFWGHHVAKQGILGHNAYTAGPWGNDSGHISNGVLSRFLAPGGAGEPGQYVVFWDWNNYGEDGCILLNQESDISCWTTLPTLPVHDQVLAYNDPATLQGYAHVLSVDGNEPSQFWVLDQAGAPSIDGNACGDDPFSYNYTPFVPGPMPVPAITSLVGCDTTGCTFNVTVGSHGVPILTDCEVAASKAINCTGPVGDPRNLYGGRQLFVKRAPCDATDASNIGTFEARTYIFDEVLETVTLGFVPYAPQDLNLNGIVDGTEVAHVPVVLTGNDAMAVPVFIPRIAGATDCAYLGVGLLLDNAPDAAACGGACAKVVTPVVSVNPAPLVLDSATPVADQVINLAASKTAAEANVSWDTTAELSTAGFNLIGVRKNGGQVQLNSALIPALEGTTGESASYSINLGARDLKGSTAFYVELVKISGDRELFGPAAF